MAFWAGIIDNYWILCISCCKSNLSGWSLVFVCYYCCYCLRSVVIISPSGFWLLSCLTPEAHQCIQARVKYVHCLAYMTIWLHIVSFRVPMIAYHHLYPLYNCWGIFSPQERLGSLPTLSKSYCLTLCSLFHGGILITSYCISFHFAFFIIFTWKYSTDAFNYVVCMPLKQHANVSQWPG